MQLNIKILTAVFLFGSALTVSAQKTRQTDVWQEAERVVKNIRRPQIPDTEFLITRFGAHVDSSALHNGEAINKAISEASCAGGGKVVVPEGVWETGPITLQSKVDLHVEKGAVLKFSTIREHYLPAVLTRWEGIDCYNLHPLIYAYDAVDVAITGEGTIDGQGRNETWWAICGAKKFGWKPGMLHQRAPGHGRTRLTECEQTNVPVEERYMGIADALRPQLINLYKCERALVEGVTLRNSPFWVVHPLMVKDLTVKGVKIISHGPNSDGCDPESCKNVLIEDCLFDTGDDCIAIKSGRNNDGRVWNIPSENIIVRNCEMKDGHGGVVVGSEITGGYRNLWVENCNMNSPELERVIRIKTNPCRGGVIENIFARNITVGECKEAVLKINLDYEPKEACDRSFAPVVRNVRLENVTSRKSRYGVRIIGLQDEENVYDISLKNCDFRGVKDGDLITGMVRNVTYTNYVRNGEKIAAPNMPVQTAKNKNYVSKVYVSDNGDGTYTNPVIYADYSDPDVCRVGSDYYMTASSFNCIPGLPILHSKDLVNWEIINYAIDRLVPENQFDLAQHGNGVWAPSIRYHKGEFFIYWGDPDNGIYMVKAKDPKGKWSAPHCVLKAKGIIDTCPLWDEDGRAYIGHGYAGSRAGLKSILGMIEMTPDGKKTIGEDRVIYDGHEDNVTIEGVKLYKRDGWYYIMCPAGGVATGYQVAMRSKSLWGPWDWKKVMAQGKTDINGPHQGGWVDTPDGKEDWFLHFQDVEAYGRLVHLNPVHWQDGWPAMGVNVKNYCGEPVRTYKKPNLPKQQVHTPVESDGFDSVELGKQWQWHANPNALWYFCDARNSRIRLFSAPVVENYKNLWDVQNLLLQKFPAPNFTATAKVSFEPTEKCNGERCGLLVMGLDYAGLIMENTADGIVLTQNTCMKADKHKEEVADGEKVVVKKKQVVWLQTKVRYENNGGAHNCYCTFFYSFDGKQFKQLGKEFKAREGKWIGAKVGMFVTRNTKSNDGGWMDCHEFTIEK